MIIKALLFIFSFQTYANSEDYLSEYKKMMNIYTQKERLDYYHLLSINYSLEMARLLDPKNAGLYKQTSSLEKIEKVLKKYKHPIVLPTPKKFESISKITSTSDYLLVQQLLYEKDFKDQDLYRNIENTSFFPNETINILIDQIIRAKREIIVETTSLSEPLVIDSLIKMKILFPDISIKILIKNNNKDEIIGHPDSSFFPVLKKYNIPIKIYRTRKQDYISSIIVDRKLIILSPSSFSLSNTRAKNDFFGIQLYSKGLALRLISGFDRIWKNKNDTYLVDIENFDLLEEDQKSQRIKGEILRHILTNLNSQ